MTGVDLGLVMVSGGLGGASLGAWLAVHYRRRKRAQQRQWEADHLPVRTRENASRLAEYWGKPVHLECQGPCDWQPVPGWLLEEGRHTTYILQRIIPAGVPLDSVNLHEARALGCMKCDSPVRYGEVAFPRAWSGKDA